MRHLMTWGLAAACMAPPDGTGAMPTAAERRAQAQRDLDTANREDQARQDAERQQQFDDRVKIEAATREAVARRATPAEPAKPAVAAKPAAAAETRNGHPVHDPEIDRRARLHGHNAATDLEQAHALENQGIEQATLNTLQRQPALTRDGDA